MTTETERMFLEAQRRAEQEMQAQATRQAAEAQAAQQEAARQAEREQQLRVSITPETQEIVTRQLLELEQYSPVSGQPSVDTKSYQQSIQDITTKLDTLDWAREVEQAYQQAGQPMPSETKQAVEQMKSIALSPAAPFVDTNKGTLNIKAAIKAGVSDKALRDIGIRQVDIVKARRDIETDKRQKEVDKISKQLIAQQETEAPAGKEMNSLTDLGYALSAMDTVKPPPSYEKAEAEFNKAADKIWERKDLTDDEKAELAINTPEWEQLQDAQAVYSQTFEAGIMSKDFTMVAAEVIVPGLYVARRWKDLSSAERSIAIAADVISLVPLYGAVVKGVRTGATFGRAAMLKSAFSGLKAEVAAQAMAPISVIIHPVGTVKATGKQILNLTENIAHPKKIPYTVLTTTDGTVRIPITSKTTPEQAVAARNLIMEKAATGERLLITAGDQTIEVATSPFMREARKAGGAAAHVTPGGEPFEDVLTVLKKEGKPAAEQGLFFANEPLPRFAKSSAFGTVESTRPTIYIASQDTAKAMKGSDKIYRNTAELERVLPVGARTSGPQQRLITRIGPNADKVQILLEKPLSARQLAKLKAETLIEAVKAPFKPAIKFKGAGRVTGLTDNELETLARELRRAGNVDQARSLLAAGRAVRVARQTPRQLTDITGRVRETDIPKARQRLIEDSVRRGLMTPEMAKRILTGADTRRVTGDTTDRLRAVTDTTRMRPPDDIDRARRITDETDRLKTTDEPDRPPRVPDEPDRLRVTDEGDRGRPPRGTDASDAARLNFPSSKSDTEARKEIKEAGGAIAWRMGQLGGKDRWDVVVNPFSADEHYYMVLGKKPEGVTVVKKGEGSAYGTTQVVKGEAPKKDVHVDSGFSDIIITPHGKKSVRMRVKADPKMETRGDITIGKGRISEVAPRISERQGRISNKGRRITPRVPKLK